MMTWNFVTFLGPKFGGYGSFLPTCQRSPPIRSQPKSPRVQTLSVLASPNHARREVHREALAFPLFELFGRKSKCLSELLEIYLIFVLSCLVFLQCRVLLKVLLGFLMPNFLRGMELLHHILGSHRMKQRFH